MQYNIRLSKEDVSYSEFSKLLRGVMPETPLGKVVSIRAETDRETIKRFGNYEKKIRYEWQCYIAKKMNNDKEYADRMTKAFQEACRKAFM